MYYKDKQSGQTLVETIAALSILVMALTAGLGLAIYSSANSTFTRDQIIATNLAREGLDVVRMFRDSNWLAAEDTATLSDDLYTTNGGCNFFGPYPNHPCYPRVFDFPIALNSSTNNNNYRLIFAPSTGGASATGWSLDVRNGSTESFLLCLQADGTYKSNAGPEGITCNRANAMFARRVSITTGNTSNPFTNDGNSPDDSSDHSPEKVVRAVVVWQGRGCAQWPANATSLDLRVDNNLRLTNFNTRCYVVMEERLTNWKDYE